MCKLTKIKFWFIYLNFELQNIYIFFNNNEINNNITIFCFVIIESYDKTSKLYVAIIRYVDYVYELFQYVFIPNYFCKSLKTCKK